jgi:hypothetical protein
MLEDLSFVLSVTINFTGISLSLSLLPQTLWQLVNLLIEPQDMHENQKQKHYLVRWPVKQKLCPGWEQVQLLSVVLLTKCITVFNPFICALNRIWTTCNYSFVFTCYNLYIVPKKIISWSSVLLWLNVIYNKSRNVLGVLWLQFQKCLFYLSINCTAISIQFKICWPVTWDSQPQIFHVSFTEIHCQKNVCP